MSADPLTSTMPSSPAVRGSWIGWAVQSLYLALQLKARYEDLDTPVYNLRASHQQR